MKGTARVMARSAAGLVERLTLAAPLPSVRRTRDVHHAHAVVVGIAAGLAHYDHVIARLETFTGHALAAQLAASTPFDSPGLHHAFIIGCFHVHEGVWVAEEKLHNIPFDFLRLPFQVGGSEGMMGVDLPAGDHDSGDQSYGK